MSGPRDDLFLRLAAALVPGGWAPRASHCGIEFVKQEAVTGGEFELGLLFDPKRPHIPPIATTRITKGRPKDFPWHRISGNALCHLDPSSIEWDPEGPLFENHVVYIAQRVISEFHRLQKGEALTEADVEFTVHWSGLQAYLDIPRMAWPPADGARLERVCFMPPETGQKLSVFRLAEGEEEGEARYSAFHDQESNLLVPCVYVSLADHPSPSWSGGGTAPGTLADLNRFLHHHHPEGGKRLWRALATALAKQDGSERKGLIVMDTKAGKFGALVKVSGKIVRGYRPQKLPDWLSQDNPLTRFTTVSRWTFFSFDEESVLGRNQPGQKIPLAGKHIHIIGQGTVGSLLADQLARAGAGTSSGSLHLYDFDSLKPENLGRHLLGAPYLSMNKADGVALFLKRNRLATNVYGHSSLWLDCSEIAGADLVIDATAVPYVGAALSNEVRATRAFSIMSAFVEGEGWVAGAFLYRGVAGEACRACAEPWVGGAGCSVPKHIAPDALSDGCGGAYTPFSAAAPSIAASLASELACDWASGLKGETFRTFRLPGAPAHVRDSRDDSPRSKSGCKCAR